MNQLKLLLYIIAQFIIGALIIVYIHIFLRKEERDSFYYEKAHELAWWFADYDEILDDE